MFSAPEKNIEQIGISDNLIVADFGAGTGAYSIAVAKAMHGTGRVYAIEVQKDLLTTLQNTCKSEHIANVSYIWGNCELLGGTKLSDNTCDLVIVSNVLFQATDKKGVISEARRVLKQSGTLLIVDWTASFNGMGPEKNQIFSEDEARKLMADVPFSFEKSITAGNFHYGLVYRKGLYQQTRVTPAHI
jgi:ubiquinone/menaquinone biosynthesis C-methylase UbiE